MGGGEKKERKRKGNWNEEKEERKETKNEGRKEKD